MAVLFLNDQRIGGDRSVLWPYASYLSGHWSKDRSNESATSVVKYYLLLFWKIHFSK
jgi:hypothetical protein